MNAEHWNSIYSTRHEGELSWSQAGPDLSLDLIQEMGVPLTSFVLDVGAGTSRLIDSLLSNGYANLGVLDISDVAIERVRERLGERTRQIRTFVDDALTFEAPEPVGLWHDRAVFHFLTEGRSRDAYAASLRRNLAAGAYAIIATFAPEGPERCSGLPTAHYDSGAIQSALGPAFELVAERPHLHVTPWGDPQPFRYFTLRHMPARP